MKVNYRKSTIMFEVVSTKEAHLWHAAHATKLLQQRFKILPLIFQKLSAEALQNVKIQ